jgi:hypothetical protein
MGSWSFRLCTQPQNVGLREDRVHPPGDPPERQAQGVLGMIDEKRRHRDPLRTTLA